MVLKYIIIYIFVLAIPAMCFVDPIYDWTVKKFDDMEAEEEKNRKDKQHEAKRDSRTSN